MVGLQVIDLRFPHQVLSLANSDYNPSETPLSTWKAELFLQRPMLLRVSGTDFTKTDAVKGLGYRCCSGLGRKKKIQRIVA